MRINCGGFELDENDFELDGETLSLKNSGGSGVGGTLVVHVDETATLDKTWQEIHDASESMPVILKIAEGVGTNILYMTAFFNEEGAYGCVFSGNAGFSVTGVTTSANGYPVLGDGSDDPAA